MPLDKRAKEPTVTIDGRKAKPFWGYITEKPYLYCSLAVGVFTLALVLLNFGLTTVYIQAYPQDFFMQLDGISVHSGQQIYTDFSSPFGVAFTPCR